MTVPLYPGTYSESFQEPAALEGVPIPLRFTTRFALEDILNGASLIGGLVDPNAGSEAVESMVARHDEAKAVSVAQQGNQFTVTMTFATPGPNVPTQGAFTIAHNPDSEPIIC